MKLSVIKNTARSAFLFLSLFFPLPVFSKPLAIITEYYGMNYQALNVKTTTEEGGTKQVGDVAHAFGFYFKSQSHSNFQFTLGTDVVYLRDKNPFYENVEDRSGNRINKESSVYGFSLYLEAGKFLNISRPNRFVPGVSVGYRYNDIRRKVFGCSNCVSEEIEKLSNAFYLRPALEYHAMNGTQFEFYYSNYFSDEGFDSGFGLRFAVPFY